LTAKKQVYLEAINRGKPITPEKKSKKKGKKTGKEIQNTSFITSSITQADIQKTTPPTKTTKRKRSETEKEMINSKRQKIAESPEVAENSYNIGGKIIDTNQIMNIQDSNALLPNIVQMFINALSQTSIIFPTDFVYKQNTTEIRKVLFQLSRKNKTCLIPLDYPKGIHFSLIAYHEKNLFHIDSKYSKQKSNEILSNICNCFEENGILIKDTVHLSKADLPQQKKEIDSGVYCCFFAEQFCKKKFDLNAPNKIELERQFISPENYRKTITSKILEILETEKKSKMIENNSVSASQTTPLIISQTLEKNHNQYNTKIPQIDSATLISGQKTVQITKSVELPVTLNELDSIFQKIHIELPNDYKQEAPKEFYNERRIYETLRVSKMTDEEEDAETERQIRIAALFIKKQLQQQELHAQTLEADVALKNIFSKLNDSIKILSCSVFQFLRDVVNTNSSLYTLQNDVKYLILPSNYRLRSFALYIYDKMAQKLFCFSLRAEEEMAFTFHVVRIAFEHYHRTISNKNTALVLQKLTDLSILYETAVKTLDLTYCVALIKVFNENPENFDCLSPLPTPLLYHLLELKRELHVPST